MKKKALQKVLALALTGALAMSMLTACGKKANNGNTDPTKAPTPTTAAKSGDSTDTGKTDDTGTTGDTSTPAGIEGYTAFDSSVTLRVAVYDRGWEGVPTVNDNYWTKWVQENFGDKYNVKVEYVPITRGDVMTDYALLASTKSLPTILMEYDYDKVAKWAADGYLTTIDFNEFAQVAPNYYNRMIANGQELYSTLNGETYFALAERPYWNASYLWQTFVRMDWLKQVGYDHVPKTYAEWFDAMTKIQNAGISANPAGGSMLTGVGSDQNYGFRNYPLDETEWAMYSNLNVYNLGWEPAYKLLKRENANYNAGITNPEYYITDDETNKANFINGKTYQYSGYIAADTAWLTALYEQEPNAELALVPAGIVDAEGGTVPAYRSDNPFGMAIGFSSTATADEVKAAWMYMEWMMQPDILYTMQWGIEGENYVINSETGLPETVGGYEGPYKQGANNGKDYWCVVMEARKAGTVEDSIAAASPKGLPQDFTQDIINKYYATVELYNQGYASTDPIFTEVVQSDAENRGNLLSLYIIYRDQLTMCSPDEFDALYDKLTKEYYANGYQLVVDERLKLYNEGKSTKLPDNVRK